MRPLAFLHQDGDGLGDDGHLPVSPEAFTAALDDALTAAENATRSTPGSVRVEAVYESVHGQVFVEQRVLLVESSSRIFEIPILPGRGSLGLFAWDGGSLRYLSGSPTALEAALRDDPASPDEIDPYDLAWLISEVCGREGSSSHRVVDAEALRGATEGAWGPHGYELDQRVVDRFACQLRAPRWADRLLTFCTVFGFLYDQRRLEHWSVAVSDDVHLGIQRRALSRRVFKATPQIRT